MSCKLVCGESDLSGDPTLNRLEQFCGSILCCSSAGSGRSAYKLWRFVGYGAAVVAVAGDQVGLAREPGVTAIGAMIVVLGLIRLTRFLMKFPKLPNDASPAS